MSRRPRAPDLLPANVIAMILADLASRRLHAMFSRWARDRPSGAVQRQRSL